VRSNNSREISDSDVVDGYRFKYAKFDVVCNIRCDNEGEQDYNHKITQRARLCVGE
jgi:hypothetical protein